MLVLLPEEIDAILEKKCYKKYTIGSFYFDGGKMIIALLTKVITGHVVIILVNVRKLCFEEAFTRSFYSSRGSGFYYCSNNISYVFICINFWLGSMVNKSGYQYIGRP